MDLQTCKAFVDGKLPEIIRELQLEAWHITTQYSRLDSDDGVMARCKSDWDYKFAHITIFEEAIFDIKDLHRTIYHELIHVALSPFEFYRAVRKPESTSEARVFLYALENTVTHLERIFMARHNANQSP